MNQNQLDRLANDRENATLELTDKLYAFAEAYGLSDDWVHEMANEAAAVAGIDKDEA
jgi:hypothetical protein